MNEELYTVNTEHQRKIDELTQLTDDMENLLSNTHIGTIFLGRDLRIRKFTPAIAEAFHLIEQDVGRPIEHIATNLDHPNLLDDIRHVFKTEQAIEQEVRSRNGKVYLERVQLYRTSKDEVEGVVLTFVNITAIQAAYESLRHVAESLELSDREFQEYAYAVSHDLQAPLRHVRQFAERIQEQESPPEVLECVAGIQSAMDRMETMIQGLLAYSRVYSRGRAFQEVDCQEILQEAQQNLRELIERSGAVIEAASLPTVSGDPLQLAQVFQHLIENGIKYAGDQAPKIQIEASEEDSHWKISVKDNGIGIAQQHIERVFIIFRRLEFKQEVEGTGLGLALCKRILHRHHGTLHAVSAAGRGAEFMIRLPKRPSQTASPEADENFSPSIPDRN